MAEINKPYQFLTGLKKLVPITFEKKYNELFEIKTGINNLQNLSKEIKRNGLAVDLSQVRWVDFGAVSQLTLFIEWLLREKIDVTLFLPLKRLSNGEARHLEELRDSNPELYKYKRQLFEAFANGRENASKYLAYIGFFEAIKCDHLKFKKGKLFIINEYDFQSERKRNRKEDNNIDHIKRSIEITQRTCKSPIDIGYKRIIPLIWIDKNGESSFANNQIEKIEKILNNAEQGIEHIDARTISDVLLHELTKNLQEHAGVSVTHALLGGVLQTTSALNHDNYIDSEKGYFSWFKGSKQRYIAIYFGDSGAGLVNTLKKSKRIPSEININSNTDFIHWSFDKWSSCKPHEPIRGTKGLYRILRIINKYEGLATVRTENRLAGYQKGGNIESLPVSNTEPLSFFPGTFIRLHLVPFKELIKFNINPPSSNVNSSKKFDWKTIYIELNSDVESESLLTQENIRDQILNYPKKKGLQNTINLFVILQVNTERIGNPEDQKRILNKIFTNLSLVRHPGAIVLYILGKPNVFSQGLIDSEIDSFNKYKQIKKEIDGEDISDPVLVLSENRQFGWIGDEEEYLLEILTKIYKSDSVSLNLISLAQESNYTLEKLIKIKQFFSAEEALAYIDSNDQIILRYNFKDLIDYYKTRLFNTISDLNDSIKVSKDYYLTPNLKIVNNWIRIHEDILKIEVPINEVVNERQSLDKYGDVVGYALALSIIMNDRMPHLSSNLSDFKILIDDLDCEVIAQEFARFNGIPKERIVKLYDEVDGKLPRRNSIFDENDKILLLTTIISSNETITRSIKTILRDSAKPILVLSLINASKPEDNRDNSFEYIWGNKIEIISLLSQAKMLNHDIKHESSPKFYIEPFSHRVMTAEDSKNEIEKYALNLPLKILTNCDALHFNHVGVENGRHFTFYLSAERLLEHKATSDFIIDLYIKEISEWIIKENINRFEIWKISHEVKHSHPAGTIASIIKDRFNENCDEIIEIRRTGAFGESNYALPNKYNTSRTNNVVFIDWGAMTGMTIHEVINNATKIKKKNILLCILFNQLPQNEGYFLSKLKQTSVLFQKPKIIAGKYDLFNFEQDTHETNIKIKFLYDLPLYYYEQLECPVCEHRQALSDFSINLPYMENFFYMRRGILKIKDRKITDNKPVDFYGDDETHELSSKSIFHMFEFKLLLRQALTSTYYRNEVLIKIKKISTKNIEAFNKQKNNVESELYSILYFLSVEIMWLQKPPLSFKSLREEISEAALQVALWDINEIKSNTGFTDKIIVRYKFAAISVLRSSDKNKFNENISDIFNNSFISQNPSTSLSQNVFYHVHSYLKRNYHKDADLLNKIISGLNSIILKQPEKSVLQVAIYLRYLAEQRKSNLNLGELSNFELIKSFVLQVKDSFNPKKDGDIERDHNSVVNLFHAELFPLYFNELIVENIKTPDSSTFFQDLINKDYFKAWLNELQQTWDSISRSYLNKVLRTHLVKMRKFLNSSTFDRYSDLTKMIDFIENREIYFGYNDEFTSKYINKILKDPGVISNEIFYKNFSLKFKEYSRLFFDYNKDNIYSSCLVIGLYNQFPTNLKSVLEYSITHRTKMLREMNNIILVVDLDLYSLNDILIFAPKDLLISMFDQIFYHNIIRHSGKQNKDIKIDLKFRFEYSNLVIDILTYGTFPNRESNGGLNKALEELKNLYEGQFINEFEFPLDRHKTEITLKLWN